MELDLEQFIALAREARSNSYSPYSKFAVGAALETTGGRVLTACNVENASYGLTICAERIAVFKAVSEGEKHLKRLAVIADTAGPCAPCGACRQVLFEFCPDLELILANLRGEYKVISLRELLPLAFGPSDLNS